MLVCFVLPSLSGVDVSMCFCLISHFSHLDFFIKRGPFEMPIKQLSFD
jgi:hypothetical protein